MICASVDLDLPWRVLAHVHHCPALAPQFLRPSASVSSVESVRLRRRIRKRHGKSLDQVASASAHARP
jgi:hypothetical protein